MMLNQFYSLVLILLVNVLSINVFARGGDLINNGGGIAEKNVLIAYERLGQYIQQCLNSQRCKVDQEQRLLLVNILEGLVLERGNGNQIIFASEKSQPGTFIIDDKIKIAKTGSAIGSPIYINVDLLYSRDEIGNYVPVSVNEAVAILIHEMGHHYGDHSHGQLDLIGIRVGLHLELKTYKTPLLPWSSKISAEVINPDIKSGNPQFLLYVEGSVVDLSQFLVESVYCPKFTIPIPILPIPDITLAKGKPEGILLHNLHWEKTKEVENSLQLSVKGDLSLNCKKSSGNVRVQDFKLNLKFSVTNQNNKKWTLVENSVSLQQQKDSWWKIIDFNF